MTGARGHAAASGIVNGVAILLVCQLAGEFTVRLIGIAATGLAFPGPVVGMVYLFIALLAAPKRLRKALEPTADAILGNLSLLFVPAAVGIVQYGPMLLQHGAALIAALIVSTILTLVVTVGVFIGVRNLTGKGGSGHD